MGKLANGILKALGIDNTNKIEYNNQGNNFETVNPGIAKEAMDEYAKDHTILDVLTPGEERKETQFQSGLRELGADVGQQTKDIVNYYTKPENKVTEVQQGGIVDGTGNNEEFTFQDIFNKIDEAQKEQWAREDEIRKHIEEREDSAVQRRVDDLRKSGINPNLAFNMPGADSGGGITNATGKDYTMYTQEVQKQITELENILDRELKVDENTKDRIGSIFETILQVAAFIILKK